MQCAKLQHKEIGFQIHKLAADMRGQVSLAFLFQQRSETSWHAERCRGPEEVSELQLHPPWCHSFCNKGLNARLRNSLWKPELPQLESITPTKFLSLRHLAGPA